MSDDKAAGSAEIVIVRRRGGDDAGGGKGGSWKIAYADFVTAMMAFFLVMWLINASNEKTRAQVASYFNPIKLTDSSTGERGLKSSRESKQKQSENGIGTLEGSPPLPSDVRREAELMADPATALEKIEARIESQQPKNADEAGGETERGASVVTEENPAPGIGDPFDPKSWEETPQHSRQPAAAGQLPETPPAATPEIAAKAVNDASVGMTAEASTSASEETVTPQQLAAVKNEPATEEVARPAPEEKVGSDAAAAEASRDAAEIAEDLARVLGTGLDQLPASITVRSIDEGTLISLTDSQSFGMFRTGSSEPEPEMVRLVAAIADVLRERPGYIVVRGHTDARPYRNTRYDNWQLSTARAHFAQYMLVRGGLDPSRIRRIEGLADRDLKNPADPQAPENRRIEVLLGRDGT